VIASVSSKRRERSKIRTSEMSPPNAWPWADTVLGAVAQHVQQSAEIALLADDLDVLERAVPQRAGFRILVDSVGTPHRLGHQHDDVFSARADADVLEMAILHHHVLVRLEPNDRVGPVVRGLTVVLTVMQHVEIASTDVPHSGGLTFVADPEDVRDIRPELAVFDEDVLARPRQLCQPLDGDAVVLGAEEAVADRGVLGVDQVQRVVVEHARTADLHVVDHNAVAVPRHEGPTPGIAQDDVADGKILAILTVQQIPSRPLETRRLLAAKHAAATDRDVFAFGVNASLDHGAARQIQRLIVGQRDLARPMDARSEVDDVGIARPGRIGLRRISKQEQRLLPAVPLYRDPEGGLRRKCNLSVAVAFELHVEAAGLHLSLGQRLARGHTNGSLPRELKRRKVVVALEEFALRGIHINRLTVDRQGIIAGNRLPCRRRISWDVCTNERGNEYLHKTKPDHRTSQSGNRVVHGESSFVGGCHPTPPFGIGTTNPASSNTKSAEICCSSVPAIFPAAWQYVCNWGL